MDTPCRYCGEYNCYGCCIVDEAMANVDRERAIEHAGARFDRRMDREIHELTLAHSFDDHPHLP